MSENEKETRPSPELPEPLRSAEGYSGWRDCLREDALGLATEFSRQFRVSPEEGVLAVLATAGHALGESMQVALPHGKLSSPFHWLAVTPEHEPVWTASLLRYLRTGLDERVGHQLRIVAERSRSEAGTGSKAEEANDPEKRSERLSEAAGLQVLRQIADTVARYNPKPPFACSPIDRAVSLLTPPGGLPRSLSKLSPLELLELEENFLGVGSPSLRSRDAASGARLSFVWQIPKADVAAFSRQHDAWLRNVPFVVTLGKRSSFPCIDTDAPVLRQLDRLAEMLFQERHTHHGNPRTYGIDAMTGKPLMRFLDEVGKWQVAVPDSSPLRWVADLGMRFSLSLMRLEEQKELDARLIENGLGLAKHFARRRIEILSTPGWIHGTEKAETADLTTEERRVYLKICESDDMTGAELRRSSHRMTATERDRIVAELLSRGLIRKDGRLLKQNAA